MLCVSTHGTAAGAFVKVFAGLLCSQGQAAESALEDWGRLHFCDAVRDAGAMTVRLDAE